MNPPVHPTTYPNEHDATFEPGMGLRDHFAGLAMHQILNGVVLPIGYDPKDDFAHVAAESYEMADAMLKARGA